MELRSILHISEIEFNSFLEILRAKIDYGSLAFNCVDKDDLRTGLRKYISTGRTVSKVVGQC